ncbi:MAG: PhoH family protein [Myxococcales bacterium]|nr:MAG: PhoH family protein [Myxococcales bacterium]
MSDPAQAPKKLYVLDTNVILHDHEAIYKFDEHDVVIPIVVLEEVDKFKRGSDSIHFQAREFIRELDKIAGERLFTEGVPVGDQGGRLFVVVGEPQSERLAKAFTQSKPDHRILAVAEQLIKANSNRQVIIVSKDINLRMKAKSLGIPAEDYLNDKVRNIEALYSGAQLIEGCSNEMINRFYNDACAVPWQEAPLGQQPVAHQFFILKNGSTSALAHYNPETMLLERVIKRRAYGIEPRNAEQTFALEALMRPEIELVSITGKAGTGKTLLALASALEQRREYRQIFLARPVVPLGNRDIGYLPGDVESKLSPYMQPLWDNLGVIKHRFPSESREQKQIKEMIDQEKLFIAPLAYIRGRSLDRIFFIVDEAQNLTPHEIKTIITRAGEGAKVVFTGDIHQIDTPYLDAQSNGLTYLVDKMKSVPLYAHINLVKGERSALSELASNLL